MRTKYTPCPRRTPWGPVQHQSQIIPGVTHVGTASHGGMFVAPERNATIPEYMRCADGWYEEDCDWAIPFAVFEAEILAQDNDAATKAITQGEHRATLRNWRPDAYERFYGESVTAEQSYIRREQEFTKRHANDWVVYSAIGRKDGWVVCHAGKGLRGNRLPNPSKCFLVSAEEYATRGHFGFIIDPSRHQEIPHYA